MTLALVFTTFGACLRLPQELLEMAEEDVWRLSEEMAWYLLQWIGQWRSRGTGSNMILPSELAGVSWYYQASSTFKCYILYVQYSRFWFRTSLDVVFTVNKLATRAIADLKQNQPRVPRRRGQNAIQGTLFGTHAICLYMFVENTMFIHFTVHAML